MKALVLAGEESGLLYARQLAAEIRRREPTAEIRGYQDYGFKTEDLAVFGIWAVLRKIFYFLRVKRTLERAIDEWKPDVVLTVDYPGMNLKLAKYAKQKGVRSVHVVCPQVWAWHQGRIPKLNATLEKICCFFPFEPALFRPGLATFVGHPLAEAFSHVQVIARPARSERLLAVLPGSRIGEIGHHLATLLTAAVEIDDDLKARGIALKVVIPAANERVERILRKAVESDGRLAGRSVSVRSGGARELLLKADAAVVASGTATLEAALARCPTVLVYKVGYFLAKLMRKIVTGVKHAGLANVLWEKSVGGPSEGYPMPELLQEDFTVSNVVSTLRPWLTDETARVAAAKRLDTAVSLLKSDGGAVAKIVDFCYNPHH